MAPFFAFSHEIQLITVGQLNNRIDHGPDTTYVINFWATWCIPCTKELPGFEKLNKNFKEEKLKVLLVSLKLKSELQDPVMKFVKNAAELPGFLICIKVFRTNKFQ